MNQRDTMNIWAIIGAVVVAAVSAFGVLLAQGTVPLPSNIVWLSPVLIAAITALVAVLSPQLKLGDQKPPEA